MLATRLRAVTVAMIDSNWYLVSGRVEEVYLGGRVGNVISCMGVWVGRAVTSKRKKKYIYQNQYTFHIMNQQQSVLNLD